jgi:hypothetical protein
MANGGWGWCAHALASGRVVVWYGNPVMPVLGITYAHRLVYLSTQRVLVCMSCLCCDWQKNLL